MLQPKYTMHGFNWFDRRGTEGVGFIRALRTLLTNHLPEILPDMRVVLSSKLADTTSDAPTGTDGTCFFPPSFPFPFFSFPLFSFSFFFHFFSF
jgi:hypothetical protein